MHVVLNIEGLRLGSLRKALLCLFFSGPKKPFGKVAGLRDGKVKGANDKKSFSVV